jgi:sugar phosphate permease
VGALVIGYVGIYLCRKNLSVAVPLLQQSFGATKAQVGSIASIGTATYAAGKFLNGPMVDRVGGRRGLLLCMAAVALFGAASALSPGLLGLTLLYGANRFAGSAGWGALLKLVPTWFGPRRYGTAVALLCLGYVVGGILATLLAREVLTLGYGWRAVMGFPSVVLGAITVFCFFTVKTGPREVDAAGGKEAEKGAEGEKKAEGQKGSGAKRFAASLELLAKPHFLVLCALSFTLTLMREVFNTWSVDFLVSLQGNRPEVATAALQSTGFDLAGVFSILLTGVAYDRTPPRYRRWLMAGSLGLLAVVLSVLHRAAMVNSVYGVVMVGAVGLLVYGPYSLPTGALAVESGGARFAATAAGLIDGAGYVAGALAGTALGWVLDVGGYGLGFEVLAIITLASAAIALRLRPAPPSSLPERDGARGKP